MVVKSVSLPALVSKVVLDQKKMWHGLFSLLCPFSPLSGSVESSPELNGLSSGCLQGPLTEGVSLC